MANSGKDAANWGEDGRKHPPVSSIEDLFIFRLHQIQTLSDRIGHNWTDRVAGLTLNEWRALALIVAHVPARATDLAELMLMDKSQLSRVVKSLENEGLIASHTDERDRRAAVLKPTTKGKRVYNDLFREAITANEAFADALDLEEARVFHQALSKLTDQARIMLDKIENGASSR